MILGVLPLRSPWSASSPLVEPCFTSRQAQGVSLLAAARAGPAWPYVVDSGRWLRAQTRPVHRTARGGEGGRGAECASSARTSSRCVCAHAVIVRKRRLQ